LERPLYQKPHLRRRARPRRA